VNDLRPRCMAAGILLLTIKPEHWLFAYFEDVCNDSFPEAFLELFGRPGRSHEQPVSELVKLYAELKYVEALEAACQDPDGEIVIGHEAPSTFYCEQPSRYFH